MKKIAVLIIMGLFLSGCAGVSSNCFEKPPAIKAYLSATELLKIELRKDLRSGKVAKGETLDNIRSRYGDPDDMLVTDCTVRVIYRPNKAKSFALWFDDGWHLSMWSD